MVHVKQVELSHFKSFGGTTKIPLLPGFTVISGPNGSGKSNILDALLFCLGLASSRGMRAERLPDLVNHKYSNNGRAAETIVSVTFDISDLEDPPEDLQDEAESTDIALNPANNSEWTVTRKLRVTKGGSYSTTFYINGQPSTASELHQQLNRLRIYPEGYNVVLQGDVTRIITMNVRERREIIDELAGVAEFDRKIEQTKKTLEAVREREDRCKIIEQELVKTKDRLATDRIKAEKYQKLKSKIIEKQEWEIVLQWRSQTQQLSQLETDLANCDTETTDLTQQLDKLDLQIEETSTQLDSLNARVKELGEEEQLSLASDLATQKAKKHQLQQQEEELNNTDLKIDRNIATAKQKNDRDRQSIELLLQEKIKLETETIPDLSEIQNRSKQTLEETKQKSEAIAAASDAWVQEQTALSHKISDLQKTLNPQRTEQAKLKERHQQLENKIAQESQLLTATEAEITSKQPQEQELSTEITNSEAQIQNLAEKLASAEAELQIQQETQKRLLKEQREKQRQLDKLEAANLAQQEAQGTYASKIILNSNLNGVCGLVAQLGQVDPKYQLALEIAAGGRLGFIVVENDRIAASGIEILKQQKAGRATFLPLNKIQSPRHLETVTLRYAPGFVDLAVNLIDCDDIYRKIFAYVFGNTVVFDNIQDARTYLGKHRIVTLAGEILEASGAMTGGSISKRSSLHFGTAASQESAELQILSKRLADLDRILSRNEAQFSETSQLVKQYSQQLTELRQQRRERELLLKQLQKEIARSQQQKEELTNQIDRDTCELDRVQNRLQILDREIPILESQLQEDSRRLEILEESQTHSEWMQIQNLIKQQESELKTNENNLRQAELQLKDLANQQERIEEKISETTEKIAAEEREKIIIANKQQENSDRSLEIAEKISQTERLLAKLSEKLGETKQERDRLEVNLKKLQDRQQKKSWQLQKLQASQEEKKETLVNLKKEIIEKEQELPNPLPEIPILVAAEGENETGQITFDSFAAQLEQIQKEIRNAQKRLQAMEPVNMLALQEYEATETRLEELSEKLRTLEAERTELLLRTEKFTTLRFQAFKEAFDAVNENFQNIFATLSEGDGKLQLENAEDPFSGGLNLIAHPKGKPVQRLSSMSGGEKSLTALSFIFALQRYRPSPFYAFDEVDMFLDGANVERLAKMIGKQSEQAQFIVVSLRRPTIESSQHTIGVTQARGAHTQVLGIKL
ncbi:MAG: chromosome segregation protein SMC [Prochloraceae cyanobacterium]|nr:chromosome segregation protein SMC [Prochloraceae cyanobacterium]